MGSRILDVPYKSQNDPDAQTAYNDCGPCCIAMILASQGQNVATSDVYAASGVKQDRSLTFDEVKTAASAFNLPLPWRLGVSLQDVRDCLDQGTPVIALIKYQYLPDRQGQSTTGGHFVLVVGYDDDAGEIVINDPYYWGPLRSKGDHHHYDYNTWEQAWGRCNEDGNPNHAILVPRLSQPAPAISGYTQPEPLPGVTTVYVLPAVDTYNGLKLRPVRDTGATGPAVFSGRPLTVVQGPVTEGDATWLLVRTQSADDVAGWACAQRGGEAYIGDRRGATTVTSISPVTPSMRTARVLPDADKYGGLKLRSMRDTSLDGPAFKSGTLLNVVADPVGKGDHEWWLVTAQDGKDTAGWVHVRQGGETYVGDTSQGQATGPTMYVQASVAPYGGLKVRTAQDISSDTIEKLDVGAAVTVIGGPVNVGTDVWVQVRSQAGNVGWARSQGDGATYLAPGQPAPAPVPIPTNLSPFGKCLAGIGLANPQLLEGPDMDALKRGRVEAVKLLTLPDPDQGVEVLRQVRSIYPNAFIAARLMAQFGVRIDPPLFVEIVGESARRLYRAGVRYFEVHNEPNLPQEGMGVSWANGAEFGAWFSQAVDILRGQMPEARWGYPGLSPQENDFQTFPFLDGSTPAINAKADWIAIHCYWQSDGTGHWQMRSDDFGGMFWRHFAQRFPDKLLMITEFSCNNRNVAYADKGRMYADYYKLLRHEPSLGAAFSFALNWPGQDNNCEGWVSDGNVTDIPGTLGSLISQPGFWD